jgi:endonuclease/exonuclease/phosphatase family metal-dependent hydrolase
MASTRLFLLAKLAPMIFGAFLCLLANNCKESENSTGHWKNAPSRATSEHPGQLNDTPKKSSSEPNVGNSSDKNTPVRFLAYNLKNYLTMRRYIAGEAVYKEKPRNEVDALIEIISAANPDILGVCEIGKYADLTDLQNRLATAGVNLPHAHRVHGSDPTRALALLSRYPIVKTNSPKQTDYIIEGMPFSISRGILDATVELPSRTIRLLGVHFKSKRPSQEADQALMRRNESLLMRQHIKDIMASEPETQLLAYGDFNDTKNSKSVSSMRGRSNSNSHMKIIELLDIYSRIDFVMTNPKLAPHINKKESKLLDPKNWEVASDHRPMLVIIE